MTTDNNPSTANPAKIHPSEEPFVPGPWHLAEIQGDGKRQTKIRLIRPVDDRNHDFGAIGYVYWGDTPVIKGSAELMAAAPEMRDEIERLTQHIANIEELAVCPECGGSLLSDHDLDCAYWGKKAPAWLHGKNDDAKAQR